MKLLNKIIYKTIGGKIKIGNFNLKLYRNHSLPFILDKYPKYGANLVRLAKSVCNKHKTLKIFDIGGNIGDTIAMLLSDNANYKILSVEGDDIYSKVLSSNFKNNRSVHIYKNFLGSKNETINRSTSRDRGTLKISSTNNYKNTIEITTLDSLIEKNYECEGAKLLKIDTDGYDNQILYGAKIYLTKIKPVIYFEYDNEFLKENGENGLDIFDYLEKLRYKTLIFFDNRGRFLISIDITNKRNLTQLDTYIKNREGSFAYYDIAVFHSEDNDIAESFIKEEGGKAHIPHNESII